MEHGGECDEENGDDNDPFSSHEAMLCEQLEHGARLSLVKGGLLEKDFYLDLRLSNQFPEIKEKTLL